MENIRQQARKCAEYLRSRATHAGTTDLFVGCIDQVVDLAIALGCNNARNTGSPGYGILFEATGRSNPGQITFFATRPTFADGVVALAISDDAVGKRAPDLRSHVRALCRSPGVAVRIDGKNRWPAVGFTAVAEGKQVIQAVSDFLLNQTPFDQPTAESTADKRVLRFIRGRRGQPKFHLRLLAAYDGRCVITGCTVVEALEAAHIVPHSVEGVYATTNGLLMRADVHTLFDLHLLSICPDKNVVHLNPRLWSTYGQFEGRVIHPPLNQADKPDRDGLARHWAIWKTLRSATGIT